MHHQIGAAVNALQISTTASAPLRRRAGGFTLIELLVALTVFAILIGLAVPSFQNMMIRNRLATQVNELLAAVQTARSEALRRNQTVRFCTTATNWQMTLQADASVIKQSTVSPDAAVGSVCADFRGDGLAYSTSDGSLMTNQPIAVSVKGQSKSLVIKMGSAYVE